MSTVKVNAAQIGQSITATNNFTWYQPASPDGTVRLGNGNSGSVTDLITVGTTGNLTFANSVSLTAASTKTLTLNGGAGSNGLVLDASNNVGIGTTAASYIKLGIAGALQVVGSIGSTTSTAGGTIDFQSPITRCYVGDGTGYSWAFSKRSASTTTDLMVLNDSGNLGLGVTPSAWSGFKAIQVGNGSFGDTVGGANNSLFGSNTYFNGTNFVFINSTTATLYRQLSGQHIWYNTNGGSGTAGATWTPNQAMTLDASGNLNIGNTSNSGAPLQVQVARTVTTNAVSIILSDLASGVQTNGVYKSIRSLSNGGSSVSEIRFLETDGTNNNTGIAFATQAVAGGLTERARIDSSGNLLIGTSATNPTTQAGVILGYAGGTLGALFCTKSESANASTTLGVYSTGAAAYRFYVGMGGTVYATSTTISAISDQRLKENIRDLDDGLSTILALKPRKFDWKAGKGKDIKNDRGFIAQEFEQVLPDLIDQWKDEPPEGEEPYKAVRPDLIPVLVKAIQELAQEIETLKQKVN